MALFPIIGKR